MANKKPKIFGCGVCPRMFQTASACERHQATFGHHTGARRPTKITATDKTAAHNAQWACHICCQMIDSAVLLSLHYTDFHANMNNTFTFCGPCKAFVIMDADHYSAFSAFHPKCVICSQRFEDVAELQTHSLESHTCDTCQIHLPSAQALQEHNSNEHFACHACDTHFLTLQETVQHRLLSQCALARPTSPRDVGPTESDGDITTLFGMTEHTPAKLLSFDPHAEHTNELVNESILGSERLPSSTTTPRPATRDILSNISAAMSSTADIVGDTSDDVDDAASVVSYLSYVEVPTGSDKVASSKSFTSPSMTSASTSNMSPLRTAGSLSRSSRETPLSCEDIVAQGLDYLDRDYSSNTSGTDQYSNRSQSRRELPSRARAILSESASTGTLSPPQASITSHYSNVTNTSSPPVASEDVPLVRQKKVVSWHCRLCERDPCEDPVTTACGHIFCERCIVQTFAESGSCPVCKTTFLLFLDVTPC